MNEVLSQHAQDLTATLAQALEPIVSSQRQIQDQMGYVQSQVMQAQMMHQQGQFPIAPRLDQWNAEELDESMENPNADGWQLP